MQYVGIKASTEVMSVQINYFQKKNLPTSFWQPTKKTYLEQIACQEDKCSSRVREHCFHGYFLVTFPVASSHTDMHTHTHRKVANYNNCVMRFLILSPMLPLPLILCY